MCSKNKIIKVILLIIYSIIAISVNTFSSNFIADKVEKEYSKMEMSPDILLNQIEEEHPLSMKIAEIVIIFGFLIFIFIFFREKEKKIEWIFIFMTFQLMRGLLLPLTLLYQLPSHSMLSDFNTFKYGMFPSGHIAIPFLFFLFTYKRHKIWVFYAITSIVVAYLIILAKQHYTIDIIASLFIAYSIKCFTERNLKWLTY